MISVSCGYALGDAIALTGAVRDFHASHPDVPIEIHPPFAELYDGIDYVTVSQRPNKPDIYPQYPLVHHLVEANRVALEKQTGLTIRRGINCGHVVGPFDPPTPTSPYTVLVAGGVPGVESKWWPHWQSLAKSLPGPIVQIGAAKDWHEPIDCAINMVGKTTIRQMASILHHASLLICPITSAMHLMRATGNMAPMIVIAGGREPISVFKYPNQTVMYYDNLSCSPCWATRCRVIEDRTGFAPCMSGITPEDVLRVLPISHAA